MSLLMSFASGFLEGHVAKKKLEADDERLQQEANAAKQKEGQDRLFTLISGGKATQEQINFAAKGLGYSQQELAGLGVAADDIENTHKLGGYKLGGNFEKINNVDQKAENYLSSWNTQFASPGRVSDALSFYRQNGGASTALASINSYETNYMLNKYAPPQNGKSIRVTLEKVYPQLFAFKQQLEKSIGQNTVASSDTTFKLIVGSGDAEATNTLIPLPGQDADAILPTTKKESDKLDVLATSLNQGSRHNMMANMSEYSYNKNPALQAAGMLHAANLLDMGIQDFGTDPQARALTSSYLINEVANQDPENNVDKMIAAVYPVYQKKFKQDNLNRVLVEEETPKDFLGDKRYNDTRGTYQAADNVVVLGGRLFTLRSEGKTSGLWRAVTEGIVGLTASTGQLSQFAQTVFDNGVADVNDSRNSITVGGASYTTTTAESIEAIAAAYGYSASQRIGEMQALEFNLAVQIARAADPSGRLSNQDFENALKQVGRAGVFSSLDSDLAALRTTIDLNVEKKKKLQKVYDLTNKAFVTRADKIALEIHEKIVVPTILLYKQGSMAASSTPAPAAPVLDVGVITQGLDVTGDYEVAQGTSAFLSGGAMYLIQNGVATLVTDKNRPTMRESGAAAQPAATPAQSAETPAQSAETPAQSAETPAQSATPTQTGRIDPASFAGKKFTTVGEFRKFEGDETLYKPILENGRIVGFEAQ